ncbi:hypothetical protein SAMN04487918_10744 [Bacillus sp. bc15]|nr:hypothetical protein SAMN04487918_10744 [Bacillus sp. bc15]
MKLEKAVMKIANQIERGNPNLIKKEPEDKIMKGLKVVKEILFVFNMKKNKYN